MIDARAGLREPLGRIGANDREQVADLAAFGIGDADRATGVDLERSGRGGGDDLGGDHGAL